MAVAITNSNTWATTVGASSSFSFTATGNYVIVAVAKRGTNASPTVTYGGVSMTTIGAQGNSSQNFIYIFGLLNPLSGSQTVNVTNGGTTVDHGTFACSLSGVNSTPIDTSNSGVTGSLSLTTTVPGCGIFHFANAGTAVVNSNNLAASTNLTNIDNTSGAYIAARGTTFPQVSAGAITTEVTAAGFTIASVSFAIAPAPSNTGSFFMLM